MMVRRPWLLSFATISAFLSGCSTTHIYDYRITNDDCNCATYVVRDRKNGIAYEFAANYTLKDEIFTTITLKVENRSRKVLSFEHARVKVSSNRFNYRYNNRFIPFGPITIKAGGSREVTFMGRADVQEKDEWRQIAGEKMTVTVKGIRLGNEEIQIEEVEFVPTNPKLGD